MRFFGAMHDLSLFSLPLHPSHIFNTSSSFLARTNTYRGTDYPIVFFIIHFTQYGATSSL